MSLFFHYKFQIMKSLQLCLGIWLPSNCLQGMLNLFREMGTGNK